MTIVVPLTPDTAPGELYASVTAARAAGATGDDAAVLSALARATERVTLHTGVWWAPRAGRAAGDVEPDGAVYLSQPVRSITSVTFTGTSSVTLAPTAYAVESSLSLGGVDRLFVYAAAPVGLLSTVEPIRSWDGRERRVQVVGVFGRDAPPLDVADATARLAAVYLPAVGAAAVNVEGDSDAPPRVGYVTTGGTGVAVVDALLAPYVRKRVKVT